jgi:hypothetical protein
MTRTTIEMLSIKNGKVVRPPDVARARAARGKELFCAPGEISLQCRRLITAICKAMSATRRPLDPDDRDDTAAALLTLLISECAYMPQEQREEFRATLLPAFDELTAKILETEEHRHSAATSQRDRG